MRRHPPIDSSIDGSSARTKGGDDLDKRRKGKEKGQEEDTSPASKEKKDPSLDFPNKTPGATYAKIGVRFDKLLTK